MGLTRLRNIPLPSWLSWVVWASVLCGLLAVGLSLFILTVLSDTRWVKTSLIDRLEHTMGGPVQIETLNLNLFPAPEVHLAGVSFETHDPNYFVRMQPRTPPFPFLNSGFQRYH